MQEPDWDLFLERLVKATRESIESFASEHPTEEVCYFAYDSEPGYGYVLTSFNTTHASLEHARNRHDYHSQYRRQLLDKPVWFDNAYYHARVHSVLPFCNNTGDFAYQSYRNIQFPEWQEFAESPEYVEEDDTDKDYLTNRVARLFCRATDRLVDEHAFDRLRLASPTLIGFAFHDHGQHVLRILNLPRMASYEGSSGKS
jgi:hypothetical protein